MTSVLGINNNCEICNYSNTNNTNNTNNSEIFKTLLQMQLNNSLASVGSFSDTLSQNDSFSTSSNSLFGSDTSNSNSSMMTMFMYMLLSNNSGSYTNTLSNLYNSSYNNLYSTSNNLYNNTNLSSSGLYKSTVATSGSGTYPENCGKACSPSIVNNVGQRTSSNYQRVYEQFNVDTSKRYTPYKNGSTYCNIYVWDVTSAMGAQIPYATDSEGNPVAVGSANSTYMNANRMKDWLDGKGQEYGWKKVSAKEAQMYANQGKPAVTAWKNTSGHGHVQMVVPNKNGGYDESKGVAISQAGSKVIKYGYITDVYKGSRLNDISYYVHE